MEDSAFSETPCELRDLIWSYALYSTTPIFAQIDQDSGELVLQGSPAAFNLLDTCEKIGAEALKQIVPGNNFVIRESCASDAADIQALLLPKVGKLFPRSISIELHSSSGGTLLDDVQKLGDDFIPSMKRMRDQAAKAEPCEMSIAWYFNWRAPDNLKGCLHIDLPSFDNVWEGVEFQVKAFTAAQDYFTQYQAGRECWKEIRRLADGARVRLM